MHYIVLDRASMETLRTRKIHTFFRERKRLVCTRNEETFRKKMDPGPYLKKKKMDPGSQKMTIGQVSPSKFESFKQSSDLTKKLSFRPNSSVSDSFWQGFCQFLPVFHLPQFLARFLSVSPSFPSFW